MAGIRSGATVLYDLTDNDPISLQVFMALSALSVVVELVARQLGSARSPQDAIF